LGPFGSGVLARTLGRKVAPRPSRAAQLCPRGNQVRIDPQREVGRVVPKHPRELDDVRAPGGGTHPRNYRIPESKKPVIVTGKDRTASHLPHGGRFQLQRVAQRVLRRRVDQRGRHVVGQRLRLLRPDRDADLLTRASRTPPPSPWGLAARGGDWTIPPSLRVSAGGVRSGRGPQLRARSRMGAAFRPKQQSPTPGMKLRPRPQPGIRRRK
jgi:hypothetical protein